MACEGCAFDAHVAADQSFDAGEWSGAFDYGEGPEHTCGPADDPDQEFVAYVTCSNCHVTVELGRCCPGCDVWFGDPCPECSGVGYHRDGCRDVDGPCETPDDDTLALTYELTYEDGGEDLSLA